MGARRIGVVLLLGVMLSAGSFALADESCGRPGNLTYNCNFDIFVDRSDADSTRIVPEGWMPWVTMGNPAFDRDDHGSAPGAPAQRIWSDGGPWTAGLYQQVGVTAGRAYEARIDWAAPSAADIERRVGIDPSGGTDPASASVIWGDATSEIVRMPDLHVSAYAEGPVVTVFVWTHHPVSYGQDQVFLDAVTLLEDPTKPPQPTPTPTPSPLPPTPTRRQPTETPSPMPATDTAVPESPSPAATETSVPAATRAPTSTPTETSTYTSTPAPPTLTPLPTRTPLPTVPRLARVKATQEGAVFADRGQRGPQGGLPEVLFLYVTIAALCGGVVLGGLVLWLRSCGRGSAPDESEPLPSQPNQDVPG